MPQKVIIRDSTGKRHVFPAEMDPKRAAEIVRSRTGGGESGWKRAVSFLTETQEPVRRLSTAVQERMQEPARKLYEHGYPTLGRVASTAATITGLPFGREATEMFANPLGAATLLPGTGAARAAGIGMGLKGAKDITEGHGLTGTAEIALGALPFLRGPEQAVRAVRELAPPPAEVLPVLRQPSIPGLEGVRAAEVTAPELATIPAKTISKELRTILGRSTKAEQQAWKASQGRLAPQFEEIKTTARPRGVGQIGMPPAPRSVGEFVLPEPAPEVPLVAPISPRPVQGLKEVLAPRAAPTPSPGIRTFSDLLETRGHTTGEPGVKPLAKLAPGTTAEDFLQIADDAARYYRTAPTEINARDMGRVFGRLGQLADLVPEVGAASRAVGKAAIALERNPTDQAAGSALEASRRAFVEAWRNAETSGRLKALFQDESGAINPELLLRGSTTLTGGFLGSTYGDTPEEHIANGLFGALIGYNAPDLILSPVSSSIAGWLSGLGTQMANAIFDAGKIGANIATVAAGRVFRPDQFIAGELGGILRGTAKGIRPALEAAGERLLESGPARTARSTRLAETATSPYDIPAPEFPLGRANPLNWPRRLLEATDIFGRTVGESQRRGTLAVNPRAQIAATPEADVLRYGAETVAQERPWSIFNKLIAQKAELARTAADPSRTPFERGKAIVGLGAISYVAPFIRQVANAIKQGTVQYSPWGIIEGTLQSSQLRALGAGTGPLREAAELQMKGVVGSIALAALGLKIFGGKTIGRGPRDEGARLAAQAQGTPRDSVFIDSINLWVPLRYVPVVGPLVSAVNRGYEAYQQDIQEGRATPEEGETRADDLMRTITSVAASVGGLVESSPLGQTSALAQFLADPAQAGEGFLHRTARSAQPFSQVARVKNAALDPFRRRPATALEEVTSGLTGTKEQLPLVGPLGEPVPAPYIGRESSFLSRFLAASTGTSTPHPDPLLQLLQGEKMVPGRVYSPVVRAGKSLNLTPAAESQVAHIRGKARQEVLAQLAASPSFQTSSPEDRQRTLRRFLNLASRRATRQLNQTPSTRER